MGALFASLTDTVPNSEPRNSELEKIEMTPLPEMSS